MVWYYWEQDLTEMRTFNLETRDLCLLDLPLVSYKTGQLVAVLDPISSSLQGRACAR